VVSGGPSTAGASGEPVAEADHGVAFNRPTRERPDQVTGTILAASSRPPSALSSPIVPRGWRRRSVGDPGLRIRTPSAVSSRGMWECPNTTGGHVGVVVVGEHGPHRGEGGQLLQHPGPADVAGVQDQVDPFQAPGHRGRAGLPVAGAWVSDSTATFMIDDDAQNAGRVSTSQLDMRRLREALRMRVGHTRPAF
jgi:hypothetical protein